MEGHKTAAEPGRRRPIRRVAIVGGAALAAGALAFALGSRGSGGWGDESVVADGPPPSPAPVEPGFSVELTSFPLLVGDRLRVTGDEQGVAAHPIGAADDSQPHWSYARPDEELLSLGLAGEPAGRDPVVAALWRDGGLTGLDATSGEPIWRVRVADDSAFISWSFDPVDLLEQGRMRVAHVEGGDVLVVEVDEPPSDGEYGRSELVGVDAADGTELWRHDATLCESPSPPMGTSRWWTMGGSVVVDVTCQMPDAELRVLDARSGRVTDEAALQPPWLSSTGEAVPGEEGGIQPVGCSPAQTDCTLVEYYPTGSTYGRDPAHWAVADGRLTEAGQGGPADAPGIEARPNGDFELFAISRTTGDRVWTMTGETHDLGLPQVADAVATPEHVWVASASWNGGPPALVRLSAADGSVTGCQPPPTESGGVTHVRAPGGDFLVVTDLRQEPGVAFDPSDPGGTIHMLVPQPQPAGPPSCDEPAGS